MSKEHTQAPWTIRFLPAEGKTLDEMRENFRNTALYLAGDASLIWVNQGDLYMSQGAGPSHPMTDKTGMPAQQEHVAGLEKTIDDIVSRAEVEWSYHEDNHRYPRDFWHARIWFGAFHSSWEQYGEQEVEKLPAETKAAAEEGLRSELRSTLLSALATTKGSAE